MNDSQNNQANWKKPDKKQYILYDSIYIKKNRKGKLIQNDKKYNGGKGQEVGEELPRSMKKHLGLMDMFFIFIVAMLS